MTFRRRWIPFTLALEQEVDAFTRPNLARLKAFIRSLAGDASIFCPGCCRARSFKGVGWPGKALRRGVRLISCV